MCIFFARPDTLFLKSILNHNWQITYLSKALFRDGILNDLYFIHLYTLKILAT